MSHRFMRRSIRQFNIPSRATPRAFELLKIGLFKFPTLGAKSRSNAPPITTKITSPQRQISSSIKHFTRFSERYAVMAPSNVF